MGQRRGYCQQPIGSALSLGTLMPARPVVSRLCVNPGFSFLNSGALERTGRAQPACLPNPARLGLWAHACMNCAIVLWQALLMEGSSVLGARSALLIVTGGAGCNLLMSFWLLLLSLLTFLEAGVCSKWGCGAAFFFGRTEHHVWRVGGQ